MTEIQKQSFHGLSGNTLKIIALITMTLDHIGVQIFTESTLLRIIGRLAFPIFAYMIAEGCLYTKNRARYLINMAALALVCQLVYFFALGSLYQCILVTFSLSIALIYLFDNAVKTKNAAIGLAFVLSLLAVYAASEVLPLLLLNTDFGIDYGFFGIMLPVIVFAGKNKVQKLALSFVGLAFVSLASGGIQWYCLLSLVLLALYSGERGRAKIKNLFYIYYPVHLVVIYLISLIFFD